MPIAEVGPRHVLSPDARRAEDWNEARAILRRAEFDVEREWQALIHQEHDRAGIEVPPTPEEAPVGLLWLRRASAHLARQLDRQFRDRPVVHSEQMAMGMIRGVATELRTAAAALLTAAERLKNAGQGYQASQAHQAGQRAQQAAAELLDE